MSTSTTLVDRFNVAAEAWFSGLKKDPDARFVTAAEEIRGMSQIRGIESYLTMRQLLILVLFFGIYSDNLSGADTHQVTRIVAILGMLQLNTESKFNVEVQTLKQVRELKQLFLKCRGFFRVLFDSDQLAFNRFGAMLGCFEHTRLEEEETEAAKV